MQLFLSKSTLLMASLAILLLIDTRSQGTEGLKCYSCEGPTCHKDNVIAAGKVECAGADDTFCYKSDSDIQRRGCMSNSTARCFQWAGALNATKVPSCYKPNRKQASYDEVFKCLEFYNNTGRFYTMETKMFNHGAKFCICSGDLCNNVRTKFMCYICRGEEGSACAKGDTAKMDKKDCSVEKKEGCYKETTSTDITIRDCGQKEWASCTKKMFKTFCRPQKFKDLEKQKKWTSCFNKLKEEHKILDDEEEEEEHKGYPGRRRRSSKERMARKAAECHCPTELCNIAVHSSTSGGWMALAMLLLVGTLLH